MITEAPKTELKWEMKKNCVKRSRCMLGSCTKKKYIYERILWTMCFEYSTLLQYSRHLNIMPNRIAWTGCLAARNWHVPAFGFFYFCIFAVHSVTEPQYVFPYSFFFFSKHICSSLFIRCVFGGDVYHNGDLYLILLCFVVLVAFFTSQQHCYSCSAGKKDMLPFYVPLISRTLYSDFHFIFFLPRSPVYCTANVQSYKRLVIFFFLHFVCVHLPIDHNLRPRIFLCFTRFVFCQKKEPQTI